jgi:hypothetical protein
MAGEIAKRVGKDPVDTQKLVDLYWTMWCVTKGSGAKKLPSIGELARAGNWNPMDVQAALSEYEVRKKIVLRGVPLTTDKLLEGRQTMALAVLTDTSSKAPLGARLKQVGVSPGEYKTWLKNPQFKKALDSLARDILEESLAGANIGLAQAAERGDINAIKYLHEVIGYWDPNAKQSMDVMAVMTAVIEIIQKHVREPALLQAIATDMQMLGSRTGIRSSVAVELEAEILDGDFNT